MEFTPIKIETDTFFRKVLTKYWEGKSLSRYDLLASTKILPRFLTKSLSHLTSLKTRKFWQALTIMIISWSEFRLGINLAQQYYNFFVRPSKPRKNKDLVYFDKENNSDTVKFDENKSRYIYFLMIVESMSDFHFRIYWLYPISINTCKANFEIIGLYKRAFQRDSTSGKVKWQLNLTPRWTTARSFVWNNYEI